MAVTDRHLSVHVAWGPHATYEDFGDLKQTLRAQTYDVYIPEFPIVPELEDVFNKISQGNTGVYKDLSERLHLRGAIRAQIDAIYLSRIAIMLADQTPVQGATDDDLKNFGQPYDISSMSLSDLMAHLRRRAEITAAFLRRRDTIISGNIAEKLPKLVESHKRLRGLGAVSALITIGDNHALLPLFLQENGFTVTTSGQPPILHAREEMVNDLLHDLPYSDELLIESCAGALVRDYLYHPDTNKLRSHLREITKGLSTADIEDLLHSIQRGDVTKFHNRLKGLFSDIQARDSELYIGLSTARAPQNLNVISPKTTVKNVGGLMVRRTSLL